jgi:hypothetical protein
VTNQVEIPHDLCFDLRSNALDKRRWKVIIKDKLQLSWKQYHELGNLFDYLCTTIL